MAQRQEPTWKGKVVWTTGLIGLIYCGSLLLLVFLDMPEIAVVLGLVLLAFLVVQAIVRR